MTARVTVRDGMQKRLEEELERLKTVLNVGCSLIVRWIPSEEYKLSGEVRGGVIYVYERDEERVIGILRHEFIDHHITSEIVKPLVEYINVQKSLIESLIYKSKEDFVERLSKLL